MTSPSPPYYKQSRLKQLRAFCYAAQTHSISKAAEKLFLEKGFASTSTTEIAKEAGCNQALVHYYYRKKDLLFTAIFEKKMKTNLPLKH